MVSLRGGEAIDAVAHVEARVGGQGFVIFDVDGEGAIRLSTFGPINAGQLALMALHLPTVALEWAEAP